MSVPAGISFAAPNGRKSAGAPGLVALLEAVAARQDADGRVEQLRRQRRQPSTTPCRRGATPCRRCAAASDADLVAFVVPRHAARARLEVDRLVIVRQIREADVVSDRDLRRLHLDGGHPRVFLEAAGHDNPRPLDDALGRHLVLRAVDHEVRLDPPPAVGPGDGLRTVLWIARRRPAIGPRGQCGDVLRGERPIVQEMAVAGVGKPRRHLLGLHRRLDRARPGACGLVGLERHGRDLAGAMARLAVLLQDRRDVLVVRHGGRRGALRRGRWLRNGDDGRGTEQRRGRQCISNQGLPFRTRASRPAASVAAARPT